MSNEIVKVPEFPEVEFDEERHEYKVGGRTLPSVTTLMQPLSSAYYGDVDEKTLNRAAERGTAIHNAIENYVKYGIEDISREYEGYFRAFKLWLEENSPVILGTECRIYHKVYRYAGTCDMPCIIKGLKILVDFKSSSTIIPVLTGVQLEGYDRAYESHGFSFDKKAIVHLKPDGKYKMELYDKNDNESWETFRACITINNHLVKFRRKTI